MIDMVTNTHKEAGFIRNIASRFARHPNQLNQLMQADAEILRYNGQYLVLKTDGIHEEIKTGLYESPYLIGWMSVTAPISDIAAVGAVPEGILLSLQLPMHQNQDWILEFQRGVNEACDCYQIYVLGGDTNSSDTVSVSVTAFAHIKTGEPLLRTGANPGDALYTTAKLGTGNAFGYSRFFDRSLEVQFLPTARLKEMDLIGEHANVCIDTSDGLFAALAVLSEVNQIGFCLQTPLINVLSADALLVHRQAELPEWMLLAGPHGEYELLFTVPQKKRIAFEKSCQSANWEPLYLGSVCSEIQLEFTSGHTAIRCHPSTIANLFYESGGDIAAYLRALMQQQQDWTNDPGL